MTAIVMGILVSQCVGAAMAAGFLSMDGECVEHTRCRRQPSRAWLLLA
jgi:hypothetical protein